MRKKLLLIIVIFVSGYFAAPVIMPAIPFVAFFASEPSLVIQNQLKSESQKVAEFEKIEDVRLFKDRYGGDVSSDTSRSPPQVSIMRYISEIPESKSKAVLSVAMYPDGDTISDFQCVNYEKNLRYNVHEDEVSGYLKNHDCFEYDGPIIWKDANSFYGFVYPKPP